MDELNWWNNLEQQWKLAFGTVFFNHNNTPTAEELRRLHTTTVLRLVGSGAPYPNMDFHLTNLSGVQDLHQLEILIVGFHQLQSVEPLAALTKLKSLFLFNNKIESLNGIEKLKELEQLYIQFNKINSLKPLQSLTRLKEVYVNNNNITSLEGLTEEHSERLEQFFCKPNDGLKQKEIIYTENQLGVRCRSL